MNIYFISEKKQDSSKIGISISIAEPPKPDDRGIDLDKLRQVIENTGNQNQEVNKPLTPERAPRFIHPQPRMQQLRPMTQVNPFQRFNINNGRKYGKKKKKRSKKKKRPKKDPWKEYNKKLETIRQMNDRRIRAIQQMKDDECRRTIMRETTHMENMYEKARDLCDDQLKRKNDQLADMKKELDKAKEEFEEIIDRVLDAKMETQSEISKRKQLERKYNILQEKFDFLNQILLADEEEDAESDNDNNADQDEPDTQEDIEETEAESTNDKSVGYFSKMKKKLAPLVGPLVLIGLLGSFTLAKAENVVANDRVTIQEIGQMPNIIAMEPNWMLRSIIATIMVILRNIPTNVKHGVAIIVTMGVINLVRTSEVREPETFLKDGIIYDFKGQALVNAPVVSIGSSYLPCDVMLFQKALKDKANLHKELCKREIKEEYTNSNIVEKVTESYILLKDEYTYTEAERMCESLGTNMVTVMNDEQKKELASLLLDSGINRTYAGIKFDPYIEEPIFSSTRSTAANTVFEKVYYTYMRDLYSWKDILHYLNKYRSQQGTTFHYKLQTPSLALIMAHDRRGELAEVGKTRLLRTICDKPTLKKKSLEVTKHWQEACRAKTERMEAKIAELDLRIDNILPSKQIHEVKILPERIKFNDIPSLFENDLGSYLPDFGNMTMEKMMTTNEMSTMEKCELVLDGLKRKFKTQPSERESRAVLIKTDEGNITMSNNTTEEDDHSREKRGILDMIPVVYSVMAFVKKTALLIEKYLGPELEVDSRIGTGGSGIIPFLLHTDYDESLSMSIQYSTALNAEMQLENEFNHLQKYNDMATKKLASVIHDQNYKPPAVDLMSEETYEELKKKFRVQFGATLPNDMKFMSADISMQDESYYVEFQIPLEPNHHRSNIYELIPLGMFNEGKRYLPEIKGKYVAMTSMYEERYTYLNEEELQQCMQREFCTSRNPTLEDIKEHCGLCNINSDNCCDLMEAADSPSPAFITIEGKSFFSINPDEPIEAEFKCRNRERHSIQNNEKELIHGNGYFRTQIGCIAEIDKITINPAKSVKSTAKGRFTKYEEPENIYEVVMEKGVDMIKTLELDLKTLPEERIVEKYIYASYLASLTIILVIFAIIGIFIRYIKTKGNAKLIAAFSDLDEPEIEKVYKHRKRREKHLRMKIEEETLDKYRRVVKELNIEHEAKTASNTKRLWEELTGIHYEIYNMKEKMHEKMWGIPQPMKPQRQPIPATNMAERKLDRPRGPDKQVESMLLFRPIPMTAGSTV